MTKIIACVINDLTYDQRMIRCCTTLAQNGFDVTLVGRVLPHSSPLEEKDFKQVRLECKNIKGPRFYKEFNLKLFKYLRRTTFDIALACDLDTALPVVFAAKLKSKRAVYDAHEWFTEVPELLGRPMVRQVWKWIGRLTVPRFDACYTVGPALARQLERIYKRKFRVVRNVPAKSTTSVLNFAQRSPIILYQGALNKGRGLEQAISAMQYIKGYKLHIAGEGDLSKELRARAKVLKLKKKVRFLGRLEPEELAELTGTVRLGLNLLEPASKNYYYSLANKVFDYLNAGTPSINMNFPEYVELIGKYHVGVCMDHIEPIHLAEAFNALLEDQNRWTRMSAACTSAREDLNWENESQVLLKIFSSI